MVVFYLGNHFCCLDKTSDFHAEPSQRSDSQSSASDPEGLGETYLAAPEEEGMLATCSEAHLRDNKVWEQSLITDPETAPRPSNLSFHWLTSSLQPGWGRRSPKH